MARSPYDYEYGPGVTDREVDLRPHRNEPDSDPNYRGGGYGGMRMEPGAPGQGAYGWYRQAFARDLRWDGGAEGRYDPRWDPRNGRFDEDGYFHDPFDEARRHAHARGAGAWPVRGYDRDVRGGREMRGYDADLRREMRGYDAGFHGRGRYDAELRGYDAGVRGWSARAGYDAEMRARGGPVMGAPRPQEGAPWDGGVRASNAFLRQYNSASPGIHADDQAWWGYAEGGGRTHPDDPRGRPTDERGYAGYNRGGYMPQPRPRQALR